MYAMLNNVADWIVGVLVVFMILFWLIPPFRDGLIRVIATLTDKPDQQSPQLHKNNVRMVRQNALSSHNEYEIFRPPTGRQLDYIDSLLEKREAEEWMKQYHPATIDEASALIDDLLNCPYSDGHSDRHKAKKDDQTQIRKSIERNRRKISREKNLTK